MFKRLLSVITGVLMFGGFAFAQMGGGISYPNYLKTSGSGLIPSSSFNELGTVGTPWAAMYTTNLTVAGTLTFSGTMGADLNMGAYNIKMGSATVDTGTITMIKGAQASDPQVQFALSADANGDYSVTADTGDITENAADDIYLDPEGLDVKIGDNADEDYTLTFDSDTNDGTIRWDEDNNKFVTSNISATTFTGALTGNADTASNLAANPADCSANQFATTIAASGALTCAAITDADVPNSITIDTATSAGKATNLAGGNATTLLGSMPYQSNTDTTTMLAPNTTLTKKYLSQTGDGTNGGVPAWSTVGLADTATALAADPANCSANNVAAGITAAGVAEGCIDPLVDVVDDTTPQLGGNLDVNGKDITSASNGNVTVIPNGTGYTIVGNAGSTSHTFNTNDDLFVSGRAEVDGILYADGGVTGNLTGNASGTAATVTGATQASITSAANLATVGTIGTGVWQGTTIKGNYLQQGAADLGDADITVDLTNSNAGNVTNLTIDGTMTATNLAATTLSGILAFADGFGINIGGAIGTDHVCKGITSPVTGGGNIAIGDLVSLHTDGEWYQVDANTAHDSSGDARRRLGIACTTSTDGNALTILTYGKVRHDAFADTLLIGDVVYASETAGAVTVTQPTTADVVIRVIGYGDTADELFFDPSPDFITHT